MLGIEFWVILGLFTSSTGYWLTPSIYIYNPFHHSLLIATEGGWSEGNDNNGLFFVV